MALLMETDRKMALLMETNSLNYAAASTTGQNKPSHFRQRAGVLMVTKSITIRSHPSSPKHKAELRTETPAAFDGPMHSTLLLISFANLLDSSSPKTIVAEPPGATRLAVLDITCGSCPDSSLKLMVEVPPGF